MVSFSSLGTPRSMWNLAPWPGIEPVPAVVEAWSLNHWTAREVPPLGFLIVVMCPDLDSGWESPIHRVAQYENWNSLLLSKPSPNKTLFYTQWVFKINFKSFRGHLRVKKNQVNQFLDWIAGLYSARVTLVASATACPGKALAPGGRGGKWLLKVRLTLTSYYLCFFLFLPVSS